MGRSSKTASNFSSYVNILYSNGSDDSYGFTQLGTAKKGKPIAASVFALQPCPATFALSDLEKNKTKKQWNALKKAIAENVASVYEEALDEARTRLLQAAKEWKAKQ